MTVAEWLKQFLPPPRSTKRELVHLRHEIRNSIQAVQSGNRLLKSMSGAIELNRRSPKQ